MCDGGQVTAAVVVMKSNSDGELLNSGNSNSGNKKTSEMTLNSAEINHNNSANGNGNGNSGNLQSAEPPRLKRAFTLPRNPFNAATIRMSKRKKEPCVGGHENGTNNMNNCEADRKKVFRRPSFRRFINKIAQHIGGVPVMGPNSNEIRVPPVGGLQTWGPDDTPGVTGLRNHGNTCFINAVIQCISHTDVLAEYFVLDKYKVDLSRRNKLNSKKYGTKGEVTEQLALMLKALWACQYSPELSTGFKQVVERHGAQYKGTQQHDALEFLQWLLDKVHEDLNTASKKKYKSIKTSGRPDEVIAAETLENHRRCNNSFIQCIFQAQYRSSLSCSRCLTQSNTFDPFQCISVQLPQLHRHSVYVTVLYTSQQPRQVKIGVSLPTGATVSELRDILESDTSIERANMLITEIGESGFLRTFTDAQAVSIITEIDPIYCIEVAQLKDVEEDSTSAYVLLCWINVLVKDKTCLRFGSPYTMQVSRETSYEDLQKLILKEMAPILHDDILTSSQPSGVFKMRVSDPACNDNEPPCYLDPELQHPLFMEAVDQALALCSEEGGPPHVKLVLEWTQEAKNVIIADDNDIIEEHSSVKVLRAQALQGGAPLTLEECLRHYTKAETLTLDDAWRCPQCQQYLPVVKTLDVWSLPDILVVHFKRFRQQTVKGRNSTKLTTMVNFPVYGFDMSPHLANKHNANLNHHSNIGDQQNNPVIISNGWSPWKRTRKQSNCNDNLYDLYAVCYHHGTDLETGHYTAACKNPYDNQWYLYDDAKVTNISQKNTDICSELVNNSAYILFYQKRSGLYVSSSSNSSSAASTSSVGSAGDHWVTHMPKFVPPKQVNNKILPPAKTETPPVTSNDKIVVQKSFPEINNSQKCDDTVTLRNSQNALHSSNNSVRKSLENKSTNTVITMDNNVKNSPTLSHLSLLSSNRNSTESSVNNSSSNGNKKPIYTTSIYINASGNVDIMTTCEKSPVLSAHRVNGVSEDDVSVSLEDGNKLRATEKIFRTTAAVHRYCDFDRPEKRYHSDSGMMGNHVNWTSPQQIRKVNHSQASM